MKYLVAFSLLGISKGNIILQVFPATLSCDGKIFVQLLIIYPPYSRYSLVHLASKMLEGGNA